MTPLERLLVEDLPTGTFGHALPPLPPEPRPIRSWTPDEQAAHVAALEAELDRMEGRGTGRPRLLFVDGEAA